MRLGNLNFPSNIIQGPLAGVSCAPFRWLTWHYGQPAFTCTEMISCKTLLYQHYSVQRRYIQKDPEEGPVCFQLSSNNPQELAEATKKVTDLGANLIDLNAGCPMRKIRTKGVGSRLLSEPLRLYHLITAMKSNTTLPISVKIRVDGNSSDRFNLEIAKVVNEAGADFLVVHGRHWEEDYKTPCHHEEIQFFVEHVKVPVIGNGDVACVGSLNAMLATGCAGVMISRASMGQPWLIQKIRAEMKGEKFSEPLLPEIGAIFLEHIKRLAIFLQSEAMAFLQVRKFAKYYARQMPQCTDFLTAINSCLSINAFEKKCARYFL